MKFPWLRDRTAGMPNETPHGEITPLMGLVLHQQQGTEGGTDSWFHNPKAQASAHVGGPKKPYTTTWLGDQWVDTADKAWAEAAGNAHWWSVEMEGHGEPLTENQIEIAARLMAELHTHHGIPLQVTDKPTVAGLGWHGMGGAAWGGHLDCGKNFRAQRAEILKRAAAICVAQAPKKAAPAKPKVSPATAVAQQIEATAKTPADKSRLVTLLNKFIRALKTRGLS